MNKGVTLVKEKCTDKVLRIANVVAAVIFALGAVFRTIKCFGPGFNFFFMITTIYFWIFIVMLGLAEAGETFKGRLLVTTYFNFLDKQFGKGLFMLFLCLMLCEVTDNAEVVLAIVCIIIAICNLIIGWGQAKKGIPAPPWEDSTKESRAEQYKVAQGAAAGAVAGAAIGSALAQQQHQADLYGRASSAPFNQGH